MCYEFLSEVVGIGILTRVYLPLLFTAAIVCSYSELSANILICNDNNKR
jgi:hypothetical protein